VFDWQTVSAGAGPSDVARVVVSSTDAETQAAHEERLLVGYHRNLVEQGVGNYTLEQCWEDYRRSILLSVVIHTFGAMFLDLSAFAARSADKGRAWTDRYFGWVDAALVRHRILERMSDWERG
jgi:hypothetical protein